MTKHGSTLAAIFALAFVGPMTVSAQQSPVAVKPAVRLPRGTEVLVRLDYGVSSKAAKVGDPIYMRVVTAVRYNGVIVIPEDAPVKGNVSEASPAGGLGQSGILVIGAEYVGVGDDRIRLQGSTEDRRKKPNASVSNGVLSVPLGSLSKGKAANLVAGTQFLAYTVQDY